MAVSNQLSVSNVVNVQISLQAKLAQIRNFSNCLLLGSSAVLSMAEGYRTYTSSTAVASDFGTTAPEYLAAQSFFAQSPKPQSLMIGRWALSATAATLQGETLSAAKQALTNFTGITNGALQVTINGSAVNLSNINFSSATNLNAVASILTAAINGSATVIWNSVYSRFEVTTTSTGETATIGYFSVGGTDTGLAQALGLSASKAVSITSGYAAETPLQAATRFVGMSNAFYNLQFANTLATDDAVAVASFIESAGAFTFGLTTQDSGVLSQSVTTDVCSKLKALGITRTFVQYSSFNPYASMSMFGRAATVNFNGSQTTLTLMFKNEPLVQAETLTETQAASLAAKNCNVFVQYNNDTSILQHGVMASGEWFDTIHGTDWLQNALQTQVWNLLLLYPKVQQTDAGVTSLIASMTVVAEQARTNGLVAHGQWNGSEFGGLKTGDYLDTGYYFYAPSVDSQIQSERSARKAPVIQCAIKLAGAIHHVDVVVQVNN